MTSGTGVRKCPHCLDTIRKDQVVWYCSRCGVGYRTEHATHGFLYCPNPDCGRKITYQSCAFCHGMIPPHFFSTRVFSLAILGAKGVGKTQCLSMMIPKLRDVLARDYDASLVSQLPESTRVEKRYYRQFRDTVTADETTNAKSGRKKAVAKPIIYLLKGKRVVEPTTIVIYDVAGEDLDDPEVIKNNNPGIHKYLADADGILFLVDPLQNLTVCKVLNECGVKGVAEIVTSNPKNILLNCVEAMLMNDHYDLVIAGSFSKKVAVAFTKTDVLSEEPPNLEKTDDKSELELINALFFEKDSLLHLPPMEVGENKDGSSGPRKGHTKDGASGLKDINRVHKEIEDYIERVSKAVGDYYSSQKLDDRHHLEKNFLTGFRVGLDNYFEDYRFFSISALGHVPPDYSTIDPDKTRPFRVEQPLLWMLNRDILKKGRRRR